ncbi:MAG: MmcQ/YjbR family DNA-binding protein [Planktomarina sp.]
MTRDDYNTFCASLPATDHVVQWGNSDVWKVGGKLFTVCGWSDDESAAFTFKVTPLVFEVMGSEPGIRPAPYLASRGMKWLQVTGNETLSDDGIRDHIKMSYDMIVAALPKKKKAELGLTS